MLAKSLLDDLIFPSPALQFDRLAPPIQPNITLGIHGSSRKLQLAFPWFIRQAPRQRLGASWADFCGLLRSQAVPMFCAVEQHDQLPAASRPIRFSRRPVDQPFSPLELRTADALEVDGQIASSDQWAWPIEVGELERLPTLVQAVRAATASTIPVGLSLPVGVCNADLNWCVQAAADFVTLVGPMETNYSSEALVLEGLVRARHRFDAAGLKSLPILLVAHLRNATSVLKLIALGASAVSIDSLVQERLEDVRPNSTHVSGGMLGGIHVPASLKVNLREVEQLLVDLKSQLANWLRSQHVHEMQAMRGESLRGLSERVCQLARVEPLHELRT